jgi:predicted alpha-1,2-mannosidase
MMRITYPAGQPANLLIQHRARFSDGYVEVRAAQHEIVGYNPVHRIYLGEGQLAGFSGYFVVRFREAVLAHGTWCGEQINSGKDVQGAGCSHMGAYVSLVTNGQPVLVKIGTSFTSLEEAEKNLDAENSGWNFENIRAAAESAWKKLLDRIEVAGGSAAQRSIFYTALYHASLNPRIVSDVDGTYNGFAHEGKLHHAASGTDEYDDYSMWDTFRTLHPLLTILDPDREQQMVQSLIDKGLQGGFLPTFPLWNSYTAEMVGDHTVAVIVDAYTKGLRHFDVASAYRLALQNAMVVPPHPEYIQGKGRRALDSYIRYGYIPLEDTVPNAFHHQEQVSRTLEYAFDDFVVSIFAEALGHHEDATALRLRSANWKNVFDPSIGFVRGRYQDGSWFSPFDPAKPYPFITEGVPWQFTFFVPQDLPGLIKACGGDAAFIRKLDGLFAANLYEQGNEPSHSIAYLYNYAGASWKTQMHLRNIMRTQYHEGPEGLPGNDDAGQMSAWYVMSAMGFYPVTPGSPVYTLGSPLFDRVVIHQSNGKQFTIQIENNSKENMYIQSAVLNGTALHGHEISHAAIVDGATLILEMGSKPDPDALR